jgi:hypothetical protein
MHSFLKKAVYPMKIKFYKLTYIFILISFLAGCSPSADITRRDVSDDRTFSWINTDTVRAGRFDTGKMWTFEHAPVDYFREEYNFSPTQEWFDHIRLAALRFATYCSASFVSADGLVMTNNHCARESITDVSLEGENLNEDGFYALRTEDERQVPGLFVEQLVLIRDVTEEVQSAVDKASEQQRARVEKETMAAIQKRESEANNLRATVTKLYHGGKYSLYGYKRYNDVRLVFTPESQLGYFGGDPDNFTYPRYNLDCTFFRVYDDEGKPLRTDNYLKWSEKGAFEGDAVFVVGNPGSTNRLSTIAQLEYMRDVQFPRTLERIESLIRVQNRLIAANPDNEELQNRLLSYLNSQKAYTGMLAGLRDPILMAKKKDFERNFRETIRKNPELNSKYGGIWGNIEETRKQLYDISNEAWALSGSPGTSSEYLMIAEDMVDIARELKKPEDQRSEEYQDLDLANAIDDIYPDNINRQQERERLGNRIDVLYSYLGEDYPLIRRITGGRRGIEAADYMISGSVITNREKAAGLMKEGPDAILNSDDPFIVYVIETGKRRREIQSESNRISQTETIYTQDLGRALFEVYGTTIPPDATFTLRIADGVVQGFPYNGTVAPPVTTFYGLYDRYYSFNREFPWSLPDKWKNPPAEFSLETPFNFVSTNDIIGGNSGSPVINIRGEVVGLAFDGNIQSLPGNFIFTTEENRTVSVHSEGMIEAIRNLYKATRLSDELRNGGLTNQN